MFNIFSNISFTRSTKVNIFYFSDYHGIIPSYRYLKSASDSFDREHQTEEANTDNTSHSSRVCLKLAGGDLVADPNLKKRNLVYKILKFMKIDASAIGNHEIGREHNFFDETSNTAVEIRDKVFTAFISCNIFGIDRDKHPEIQSRIIQRNGEKFGIIGVTTFDYEFLCCNSHNLQDTEKDIKKEIKRLKRENPGLNKIILLSHLGFSNDKIIAKTVSDIDVIVGGHSHTKIEGVHQDYNLFFSPKKEPVVIVQAGNEQDFGTLDVTFNDEGVIDLSEPNKPRNDVKSIFSYPVSQEVIDLENKDLGATQDVCQLKQDWSSYDSVTKESVLANITADAVWDKTNADFALINAGTFRAFLKAGMITARDIEYCLPMPSMVVTARYTKQQLLDALQRGVDSTQEDSISPGIFKVAGLRYAISSDGKVNDVYTVDKDGRKKIQLVDKNGEITKNSPDTFLIATTSYMLTGPAGLDSLKKVRFYNGKLQIDKMQVETEFGTHRDILIEYLKREFLAKNRPLTVGCERITFEEKKMN